jgi:hypothetical protein
MKLTFETWKSEVDCILEQSIYLSADDLPDWDYYGAWESGVRPIQAARQAIRQAQDF